MNAQFSSLLSIGLLVAAFWFLLIRPQQQRQAKQRELLENLAVGSEVLTASGIFGTVIETGERVRLRVADGEIEVVPAAIGQVIPAEAKSAQDEDVAEEDSTTDADA